jgi:hypothetical protein
VRLVVLLAAALVMAPAAYAEGAHVGYPSSIAALGDSDTTGFDTVTPNRDAPQNSWSAGTNPAVNSVYLRILAASPRINGHASNFAEDGSGVTGLLRQARLAVGTHAEYVTIESGGNDACPDAKPVSLAQFQAGYVSDGSLCDPGWDAAGHPNPTRDAFLEQRFASYDAAMAAACGRFIHCRYDGDALVGLVPTLADFSFLGPNDPFVYTHPSVQGLAKMAAAAWDAGFDFGDARPPVSHARRTGRTVTLAATDAVGIEYRLKATGPWTRYAKAVRLAQGARLTWRAVDVNGNCEATHSLK